MNALKLINDTILISGSMTDFILTDVISNVNKRLVNVATGVFSLDLLDNGNLACGTLNQIEIWDLSSFTRVGILSSSSMG